MILLLSFLAKFNMVNRRCKDVEWNILKESNNVRGMKGSPRLRRNRGLNRVARNHSNKMARSGRIYHGDGPQQAASAFSIDSFRDFLSKIFSTYSGGGENCHMLPFGYVRGHGKIRSNRDVARAMVKDWMRSPGHRKNLLNFSFRYVGIGIAKKGKRFYATQLFFG